MPKSKGNSRQKRYTPDFKVKVIKATLEKKLSAEEVTSLYGVGQSTWWTWKRVYKKDGEQALRDYGTGRGPRKKKHSAKTKEKVRKHVVEVKRKYPFFGIARVWQWMLRALFIPVSYRQVREAMAEEDLIKPRAKRKRKPAKPKRFERARPNQMWQTDITEFNIASGMKVWLIGFMDDHSRYIVSWGLYAGCSGELVLEVLRRAFATYGRPEEMLTDNGPQYKTWRGTTEFQRVLQQEGIKHILSRKNHPQTLGKIEAFWGHLKSEWLEDKNLRRGTLEEMRERMDHWIKFYNFQRPHDGIGYARPAERFFKYAAEMRKEAEKRLKENEKDLAFSEPEPPKAIGQVPMGEDSFEIMKEGKEFVVRMGEKEISRTNLKENDRDEAKEGTAGQVRGEGSRSDGEGIGSSPGAVGGKDDLGGVPGDGAKAHAVLQDRGPDGGSDAPGSETAGQERPPEGPGRRGNEPGGGDGRTQAGAPEDAEPGSGDQEALPETGAETGEKRPREAEKSGSSGDGGGAGSATASGETPPAAGSTGVEGDEVEA